MARPRVLPDPEPRPCERCGEVFVPKKRERSGQRFCSRDCQRLNNVVDVPLEVSAEWGRRAGAASAKARPPLKGRYLLRGRRYVHRIVAEEMLGRPLRSGEVVHHINGDTRDNRPENLEVLSSQGEHNRLHGRLRQAERSA